MSDGERIIQVNIENQMKTAYIDYSMSVIVARALPDARDGMKPVHRRILYAMWDQGILAGRPHKKSARIVGEVLGKYHPHGDTAVYDAMVRMAQDWSMRLPYVDGQGNFGSVDGDGAAAMRYTEARLRKCAEELLNDIEKDTVDMRKNFSEEFDEPTVLPAKIPALLVNGSSGIAVGMATNMAPHNLGEVCDGIIAYIDNNDITIEELMHYIKGPDFPSGCAIYGYDGVRSAFTTGRGRVIMRGDATIEDEGTKPRIIVTSLPYLVGPSELISHTAELVKEGKIDGIANIENLSNKRNGTRIVYELKRDAIPNVVLNKLYQLTALQSSFSINNVALVNGRPETLNLKQLIECYVKHRHEVIIRRAQFELKRPKSVPISSKASSKPSTLSTTSSPPSAPPKALTTPVTPSWNAGLSLKFRPAPSSRCASASSPDWNAKNSRTSSTSFRNRSNICAACSPSIPSRCRSSKTSLPN